MAVGRFFYFLTFSETFIIITTIISSSNGDISDRKSRNRLFSPSNTDFISYVMLPMLHRGAIKVSRCQQPVTLFSIFFFLP